jgi:dihydrodipicolinate synthase/N-acetylneuraminate lyase
MPFVLDKNRELDLKGLVSNISAYGRGFDGYMAFGCMGEFHATSFGEYKKVVDTAVDATKRSPVCSVRPSTILGNVLRV